MPNAAAINKQLELYIASLEEKLRERDQTIAEMTQTLEQISDLAVEKDDNHRVFCDRLVEDARENEEKLRCAHKKLLAEEKERLADEHRREINRLKLEHKMKVNKMEKDMELMMSMANKVCSKIEGENGFDLSGLEYPDSPSRTSPEICGCYHEDGSQMVSVSPREDKSESYVSRYEDGTQMVSVSPRICVDDTNCPPPSTSPRLPLPLYEMPDYVKRMSQPSPLPRETSTQYVFPCYDDGTPMVSTTPR